MDVDRVNAQGSIDAYRRHDRDTGSTEVQIAVLTSRIAHLTDHLRSNRKDHSSQRGLMKMVGRRSALLKYLRRLDHERYRNLITAMGLRK